jgi:hypothetical protein
MVNRWLPIRNHDNKKAECGRKRGLKKETYIQHNYPLKIKVHP